MEERIKEVYQRLNTQYMNEMLFPNKTTRERIKTDLEREFRDLLNLAVKCDEENNPVNIVVEACVLAKIMWSEQLEYKYCNMIFGDSYNVEKIVNEVNKQYYGTKSHSN